MNKGIDASLCSLSYARIDDAVAIALDLGTGCLLAKLDLHAAYRQVPVHTEDRPFLALRCQDQLFLDAALPFGLRSAPKIFSAVADAVLRITARSGVSHGLHYLVSWQSGIRRMRAQLSNRAVVLQFSGPSRGSAQGRRTVVDPCFSWHRDRHGERHPTIASRQVAALTPLPTTFDLSSRLYKATAALSLVCCITRRRLCVRVAYSLVG